MPALRGQAFFYFSCVFCALPQVSSSPRSRGPLSAKAPAVLPLSVLLSGVHLAAPPPPGPALDSALASGAVDPGSPFTPQARVGSLASRVQASLTMALT